MPERMNTEIFRMKMKEIHGDKYDFSDSEFNDWKVKVSFKCPVHGLLSGYPYNLLQGKSCKRCNLSKTWKSGRKGGSQAWAKDEVEKKLRDLHGDSITFSGISASPKLTDKVNAYCAIHGEFKRKPTLRRLLIEKTGCVRCNISSVRVSNNTRDYIADFREIHGEKYDYSRFEFKGSPRHVTVICPIHGPFPILVHNHLKGRGCPPCGYPRRADSKRRSTEDMVRRFRLIHSDKYSYEKMVWVDYKTEITVTCPNHGDFPQDPRNHNQGKGCPSCKTEKLIEERTFTKEDFISKAVEIHGEIYDYSLVNYVNSQTKILIICKKHGSFPQLPNNHLRGNGCPKCYHKSEGRIARFLHLNFITHRHFKIQNRRFDFYLPDFDLIIERDGEQHYHGFHLLSDGKKLESLEKNHQIDIEKTALAKQEGLTICRLPYWLNFKEEIIETINIIHGKPTYPDVPDLGQADTQPPPVTWDNIDYEGYVTTDENDEEDLDSFFDEDGQGSFDF